MTKQANLAYCKVCKVNVDLRQGFHKCIEENQCFSDDPCPLSGKFHQLPAQKMEGAAAVTAVATQVCANAPGQSWPDTIPMV